VPDDIVSELIDDAYENRENMEELREKRTAIRNSLRNLKDTGRVTEDQAKEIDEIFPPITRKRSDKED
jgi:hypothetical protein